MSDKEQMAILRLREASEMSLSQYKKPLLITSSGGKDSSVCVELARRAGIPFEVLHCKHCAGDQYRFRAGDQRDRGGAPGM